VLRAATMQYLGFSLVALAVVALVIALVQRSKGRRILAAPFKRTGETARNPSVADAKGIVSCEGAIVTNQPAFAPCSGTPCVYFEVEVIQRWTKRVETENGTKTEQGHDTVQTIKSGNVFYLDDGSGPIAVNPREGMDVELDTSFEQEQGVSYGDVQFGRFRTNVLAQRGDKRAYAVKVIEKIVPAEGGMFVMGQLANACIGKPQAMLGTLRASRRGRNALLGATKRNATIGFVAAAMLLPPGAGLSAFADPPAPAVAGESACNILDESKPDDICSGKIYGDNGSNVPLTISQAGTFEITAGPPRGKKLPVIAEINVVDESGKALVSGADERASVDLAPGKYTINVHDSIAGDAKHFKGGLSYELAVKRIAIAAVSDAGITSATLPAASSASSATPPAPAKPAAKAAAKHAKAKPAPSK
jgi:hypothetical protein